VPAVTAELLARPPPGLLVAESALDNGHAMQALLHVLQPGPRELEVGRGWAEGWGGLGSGSESPCPSPLTLTN